MICPVPIVHELCAAGMKPCETKTAKNERPKHLEESCAMVRDTGRPPTLVRYCNARSVAVLAVKARRCDNFPRR